MRCCLPKRLQKILKLNYQTQYASINVPSDNKNLEIVKKLIQSKQKLNIKSLIVIGIGGSNLGTIAIHEALNGKFYNEKNPKTKVYFADTVDSDYLQEIIEIVENELKNNENENKACVGCFENMKVFMFTPCNHLVYCGECIKKMSNEQKNKCPMCRNEGTITKIFF